MWIEKNVYSFSVYRTYVGHSSSVDETKMSLLLKGTQHTGPAKHQHVNMLTLFSSRMTLNHIKIDDSCMFLQFPLMVTRQTEDTWILGTEGICDILYALIVSKYTHCLNM